MAPKNRRRRSKTPAPALEDPYCSPSIASALGTRNANASTLGTPVGFTIPVAVLNIGMPTANHFCAQPGKQDEASGGHDTPKYKQVENTGSARPDLFSKFQFQRRVVLRRQLRTYRTRAQLCSVQCKVSEKQKANSNNVLKTTHFY